MTRNTHASGLLLVLAVIALSVHRASAANTTWCWGSGQYGALGSGMTGLISNQPVQVSSNESFVQVCTGPHHSCALDGSGRAFCWGWGNRGALGNGGEVDSAVPVPVSGGHLFAPGSLGCGQEYTCALNNSGTLWCWGDASQGNFGNGENNRNSSSVPKEAAKGFSFASVAVGTWHACGIQDDARAFCWGKGTDGQLGIGKGMYMYEPQEISGGHRFKQLSAGSRLTCGIDVDYKAWCFGAAAAVGDSNNYTDSENAPLKPVAVSGNHAFSNIAAGVEHACAIDLKGSLWCWGSPPGNGFQQGTLTPMEIKVSAEAGEEDAPSPPSPLQPYVALSVGDRHTCAIDSAHAAWCFGEGPDGELGTGSFAYVYNFTPVAGNHKFVNIDSSVRDGVRGHSCAVAITDAAVESAPALAPAPADTNVAAPSMPVAAPASSSSSSVPIGAIAGGTVGAAVVLALLAFLAWRYKKGRLRHLQPGVATCDSDKATLKLSIAEIDTFWQSEDTAASLKESPINTSAAPLNGCPASHQAADPALSLIASVLASKQQLAVLSAGSAGSGTTATPGASGRSESSGGMELRTDAKLWEVQWSELSIVRPIGKGSFGSVYLAEWNQTLVACKVLITQDSIVRAELGLPEEVMHDLQAEAAVMSRMRHPNIVQFMGLVAMPPVLITEYCSRGSLYDCLAAARESLATAAQLTWHRRLSMAVDGGTGLLYLHRRNIIHRDVKSPNLLVDEHWRVKVSDFNLSKLLEGTQPESSLTSGGATNPIWLAPEVLRGEKATAASDVYSFGMVLFELLTWRLPWKLTGVSLFKVGATISAGGRPEVPPREALPGPDTPGWPGLDAYVQLMRDCWAQQPGDRPTFNEVVHRLRALLNRV